MKKHKYIYYLNQFFAQIGGEKSAYQAPVIYGDVVGPGKELQKQIGAEGGIAATVICGDTYFAENQEKAIAKIIEELRKYEFDVFIAGPAFNAGRYGIACGALCKAVQNEYKVPAVTSMYHENPGAELYCRDVYVLKGGMSAASMRKDLSALSEFAVRLANKSEIGFPEEEGYIPQGIRVNVFMEKTGAVRGVDMLLKKLKGEHFETELPMPVFDRVTPAPAVKNINQAVIALITSGGVVPKGNPDRIESANATKFGKYSIENISDLVKDEFITVHGGYDPVYVLEDPDRVLPLDVMRLIEKEGRIGKLFDYFYSTVGNTTAVTSAERFGKQIGEDLLANGVSGAILTST
jgi:glycine reductase